MLVFVIQDLLHNKLGPLWILLALFFVIIILVIFLSIKEIKYITIKKDENRLTWYSIFNPYGATIFLNECVGQVKTKLYSTNGATSKIYLIDKNRISTLGINELVYSNFNEIQEALKLNELTHKNTGVLNYLKLLYTGRIKIEK